MCGNISNASRYKFTNSNGGSVRSNSWCFGAYMYLFPKAKNIGTRTIFNFFFFTTRLPAVLVIGMWIIIQFINISFVDQSTSNVAWFAHIGGFIFGLFYCVLFVRKKIN